MKNAMVLVGVCIMAGSLAVHPGPAIAGGLPVFRATCPTGINVDADRTGAVYINGGKAIVKKVNDTYYEAKGSGVTISISLDPGAPPMLSYTGKGGANGICQVADYVPSGAGDKKSQASSSERAGQGQFDATGKIPCAQYKGQPMGQCSYGVARDGGGSATVVVTRPDGRKRAIFFEKGKAIGADLSQADGNMDFSATKEADLYKIKAGDERYEIPEAVIYGG
jgi:hypothetical protein